MCDIHDARVGYAKRMYTPPLNSICEMCEFSRSHKIKCFMTRSEKKNIAALLARKRHIQMRNSVHDTLFFIFRLSKKTGLADQLKFVRVIQNISIYPNRKISKCDLAFESAETPRWLWLLKARRKKTRLRQISGHSRLHLFLTDQEFLFPEVAPSLPNFLTFPKKRT